MSLVRNLLASAAVLLSAGAAQANITFNAAPAQNELQKKYFDWVNQAGGLRCEPKGALKKLVNEPNKCYLDLDECAPSIDGLQGKVDADIKALLHDLIKSAPKGKAANFTAACPGENGPQFTHLLGFKGVAYTGNTAALPDLHKLATPENVANLGQNVRTGVTYALSLLGKNADSEKALINLIKHDTRSFKHHHRAIQTLDAWGSDGVVDYCTDALTSKKNQQLVQSCIMYLGHRKAKGAYSKIIRVMEKNQEVAIRALGDMGEKKAIKVLEEYLEQNDNNNGNRRIGAVVSLVNLGAKKHQKELMSYLKGEKHLSKKQLEREAKKAAKAKKRKKKKKAKKKEKNIEFKLVRQALMESTRITNKAALKAVKKAMVAATKLKDPRGKIWEHQVYGAVALAQMGDKKAVKQLVEFLDSPKEKIRKAVIDTIGGRWHVPHSNYMNRGTGVVADASLLPAVYNYYNNEPKKADKTKAVQAAAVIKAHVALSK
jgi:HEAT repeat protein